MEFPRKVFKKLRSASSNSDQFGFLNVVVISKYEFYSAKVLEQSRCTDEDTLGKVGSWKGVGLTENKMFLDDV